ncbi:MAG: FHA domain-containing protein [Chloroflexaceae bacterium]|nr:FHA domain-containing protein [Chloroflexaceae bacterium]
MSRRHAQITEERGQFYLEGLSQNPTMVEDAQGNRVPLHASKHRLHHGDRICLERSQITLKFLIRDEG